MSVEVDVCIVGGGPAGMMLATLLASRGVKTLVLEKNDTFEREFRGEVLQSRFSRAVDQVGLKDFLLSKPSEQFSDLGIYHRGKKIGSVDLAQVDPDYPYAVWMTQPEMLRALQEKAEQFPEFDLWFHAKCQDLIQVAGRTVGVTVQHGDAVQEVRARVVVGSDGRFSTVVKQGGFESDRDEYPFDVMWFQVERPAHMPKEVGLTMSSRHNYITLPKYPDLIQCGLMMTPGEFGKFRKQGIEAIKKELRAAHPLFHKFADELERYNEFHVLQAKLSHRRIWAKDGLLLVGDAAHTCSPIGAVGVSIAVETAIVAADVLLDAYRQNDFSQQKLSEVQQRRAASVNKVLRLQSIGGKVVASRNPLLGKIRPIAVSLGSRLGVMPGIIAQLISRKESLPIFNDLRVD